LIGGFLVGGAVVVLLIGLTVGLVTKLTNHSAERFGWPVFMNWWNLLHVAGFLFGGFVMLAMGANLIGFVIGYAPFWLAMLVVNIWKTNLPVGMAISFLQPFYIFAAYMVWVLSRRRQHS